MDKQILGWVRHAGIWSGISIGLFIVNTILNRSLVYLFLPYNLVLAWAPLGFAWAAIKAKRPWQRILALIGWLLFLPNAFYIITDYIHVFRFSSRVSYVFDAGMIGIFTVAAFMVGIISFLLVIRTLEIKRRRHRGALITVIAVLCGGAIYAGRVLRWNSWDIIVNPHGIASNIIYTLTIPGELSLALFTTALFGTAIACVYILMERRIRD